MERIKRQSPKVGTVFERICNGNKYKLVVVAYLKKDVMYQVDGLTEEEIGIVESV
jgi:hypothetical protein